jgi:type II secretory pathway component PulF
MVLTDSPWCPSMFPAMEEDLIKVGQKSGKFDEIMKTIASTYEK